jgi:aminomethyltransferase
MCFPLYGHELNDDITPYEAGLGWLVTLEKEEGFIGCEVLVNQYRHGVKRKLVAVETVGKNIARQGYPIMVGSERVGEVTSGTMSPTLNKPIALGFVNTEHCQVGTKVKVSIRGNMYDAMIVDKPFTQSNVKKKPKT